MNSMGSINKFVTDKLMIILNKGVCIMVNLVKKGQKVNLTKDNPHLTNVAVGLGWDTNRYNSGFDFDLDAVAFLLNASGKVRKEIDFVFFNNLQSEYQAVVHVGDNRTGEGAGDDETILIDFAKVPDDIERIAIAVTIYEADTRNQNFGQVSNSYVRIIDESNGSELIRYDLGEDYSSETAMVVCELYKHNGEWKFSAIGSGFYGGLQALVTDYGL